MAIDTPQVIQFANGSLRPLCNKFVEAYDMAVQVLADYKAAGIENLLPNEFDNMLADGSAADGRPQISAGGVRLTFANLELLIGQLEAVDQNTGLSMIAGCRAISPRYASQG